MTETKLKINLPGAESITPEEVSEPKYQHYNCSKQSMKMLTTKGTPIIFVRGEMATTNKEVIAYLDKEIELGLNVVTKGQLLTAAESDPMTKYRETVIADYLAEQAKNAKKAAAPAASKTGILGSNSLLAAEDSNSSDSAPS